MTAARGLIVVAIVVATAAQVGCPGFSILPSGVSLPVFNNTIDPTNRGASFIGSDACSACHPDVAAIHRRHGHAHQLTAGSGAPPTFPAEAARAGVPDPPGGQAWTDIAFVIGGYRKRALFIDQNGFIQTNGVDGFDAQWNLDFPANGTVAEFVPFEPAAAAPMPYDFDCFRCHTTGPMPQDPATPQFQDGRAGIPGTWSETGVQCEACHGPGSNHAPNPSARDIYVNGSSEACGQCHMSGADPNVIPADGGFVDPYAQVQELRASGGHADFSCGVCHDPHASVTYDRGRNIRNGCTVCHPDQNMALHEGKTFVRGDYVEPLTCESCHMPFSGRLAGMASASVVGPEGRMGDTRSHIFRISLAPANFSSMFTPDGSQVVKDASGRAAVTVDFVCVRCHNGGGLFALTVARAAEIAPNVHRVFE